MTLFGFGAETNFNTDLTYAVTSAENNTSYPQTIIANDIGQGHGVGGDSGGPLLNTNNDIVAIIKSGTAETNTTYGTDLFFASDWILETINGWHYPTQAHTNNGLVTITVQSLHDQPTADFAYTSDDATIVGGTCQAEDEISPFEKCTYIIESQGGEGKLILDKDEEFITINKQSASGGESGGALGLWGLLALAGLGFGRRKAA